MAMHYRHSAPPSDGGGQTNMANEGPTAQATSTQLREYYNSWIEAPQQGLTWSR